MTLREKQAEFLVMVSKLISFAEVCLHKKLFVLEWYRTRETQESYVRRGVSKTMNSKHLKGLAVDLAFLDDVLDDKILNYTPEHYKPLGEYWEKLGGRWGGRFGDNPATEKIEGWDSGHFEYKG